jgi:hypothetical protein
VNFEKTRQTQLRGKVPANRRSASVALSYEQLRKLVPLLVAPFAIAGAGCRERVELWNSHAGGAGGLGGAPSEVDVGAVTWRSTFEPGDLSEWDEPAEFVGSGIEVVKSPVREGSYAALFSLAPGDDPLGDDGERAELRRSSIESEGVESVWGWSSYFPDEFVAESGANAWTIFFHFTIADGAEGCKPPLQLDVAPDGSEKLRLVVRGGQVTVSGATCETLPSQKFVLDPLERGRWYDFVLFVRWSQDAERGEVALWIDDREVVPRTPLATLYPGVSVSPKLGLYRSPSTAYSAILHDELRRGTRLVLK